MKLPTRGSNVLDKIFTNISKFYNAPDIVPPLGFSDHNSVLLMPLTHCKNSRTGRIVRDAQPSNRRFIGEVLSNIDWSALYSMNSCKNQFQYFSSVLNGIIVSNLPLKHIKSDSSDKPWITSEIKGFISKRQAAWTRGNALMFRFYRNKVNVLCTGAPAQGFTMITLLPHFNQILTSGRLT